MFKSHKNPFRGNPRPRRQRNARIGVESLGDRLLMAAQITSLVPGTLNIIADAAGGDVKVDKLDDATFRVWSGKDTFTTYPSVGIVRVDFQGGAGNDVFENATSYPCFAKGGAGNDVLRGGAGNDTLMGNDGDDILIDGRGKNTLDGGTGSNSIAGIDSNPMTTARLNATGSLWAAVEDLGNGSKVLTLSGPSGYGMQLVGDWKTTVSGTSETFSIDGTAVLKTALGDLTLAGPITITTALDGVNGAGRVTGNSWSYIDFANEQDPNAPAAKLKEQTGISLNMPTVAGWGIKLGKDLKEVVEGPWNDAIPYLYVNTTTLQAMRIGSLVTETPSASMGVPQTNLVVDPSDFFMYVGAKNLSLFGVSQFGFGYSTRGLIPFTPLAAPTGAQKDFRGHVYIDGRFDMSEDAPLDFGQQGGNPLSFNGQFNLNLATTGGLKKVGDVLSDPAQRTNIAFAANVKSSVSFRASSPLTTIASVQVPFAGGTMVYDPVAQAMRVRVATINPLKDIPGISSSPLASVAKYDADVELTVGKTDFLMNIKTKLPGSDCVITATKSNIVATGTVKLNLGSVTVNAWLKGTLFYDGKFQFEGDVSNLNLFGVTGTWRVVWTQDGLEVIRGAKAYGQYIEHTFVNGFRAAEEQWNNGVETLHRTWDKAGGHVLETWDSAGTYIISTYQNGVIATSNVFLKDGRQALQKVYTAGRLTLQRAWDATGQSSLETWDSTGGYVLGRYDSIGRIVYQATMQNGVLTFRRTWDYAGGKHILEVYNGGVLASKQLWNLAGQYIGELEKIAELWNKFIGLL